MMTASPLSPSSAAVTASWAVRFAVSQAVRKASVEVKDRTASCRKSRTVSWSGPRSICRIASSVMRSVTVLCTAGSEESGETAATYRSVSSISRSTQAESALNGTRTASRTSRTAERATEVAEIAEAFEGFEVAGGEVRTPPGNPLRSRTAPGRTPFELPGRVGGCALEERGRATGRRKELSAMVTHAAMPGRKGARAHARPRSLTPLAVALPLALGIIYGFYAAFIRRDGGPSTGGQVVLGLVSGAALAALCFALGRIQRSLPHGLRAVAYGALTACAIGFLVSLTDTGVVRSTVLGLVVGVGVFLTTFYFFYSRER
ncbi:hypothetical protein SMICM17S_03564 [Streptomyces microflavus]